MEARKRSGPSRRGLIAGAAAAPLLAAEGIPSKQAPPLPMTVEASPSVIDPVVELAREAWLLHRENERLHRRYGTVEAWLVDKHNWFKLTEAERHALPAGRKLYAIHERWAVLDKELPRSIRRLRRLRATSIGGVIGKLQVVAAAMEPDEFPSAFSLLKSTIGDLKQMRSGR
ncbi:MAG TPA: hypothetical protein VEA80_12420 [Vitreimonas sp.]|uniref:hypothetical protein n=1 Tax=Vitreimonas sp. TaxID=3069702 RepID=UPI002D315556|nr:hypothetical protein [Vitreimonas sp.]HYD88276.1 hypothetical protein [Vitreimonas sp.]